MKVRTAYARCSPLLAATSWRPDQNACKLYAELDTRRSRIRETKMSKKTPFGTGLLLMILILTGMPSIPREATAAPAQDRLPDQKLTPGQKKRAALMKKSADLEKAAAEAETSGKSKEAFAGYLQALGVFGDRVPCAVDVRLREKILGAARRLDSPPAPRERARKIFARYSSAANGERHARRIGDLAIVLGLAPWWPEPYAAIAQELEAAGRLDEAATAYRLFLSGAKGQPEAKTAQTRLSDLEARAPKPVDKARRSSCIPCNTTCTLHGTDCCGTCVCEGKFPNTSCTDW